ncbi:MAG: carbon starvation protein A [Bacteroidetes bacterium]|nr:carbon starvation protein A [Bacteroidota bacterium]HET6244949.1 carbon starvation protein A [Bacteroidia bacterium]
MNAAIITFVSLVTLFLGYRFYSKFIAQKIFRTESEDELMPSEEFRDEIDFVPTKKHVLFGHHFSSIAGAAPILGPAIAVVWGWLPAIIWVVLGSIFIGAVHDFGTLVISARNKGKSIGLITQLFIGERSKLLFLTVIFLLVFIVIAVFAYLIANLFVLYPGTVIPINFEIFVAVYIGFKVYKNKGNLLVPSIIALVLLYFMTWVGFLYPVSLPEWLWVNDSAVLTWIIFLMIYGFIAAVLPVWTLLQPRDYINSHQLIVGLILIYAGIFIAQPIMDAPAINLNENNVSWFPFLFITIACGAVSGFHSLVSSGTTSKQLKNIKDARFVGYGGMIGEATLALAATIAVAAGFDSSLDWHNHYGDLELASGMQGQLKAFVNGTSGFLAEIGLNQTMIDNGGNKQSLAAVFISVLIISFAATSLDTAVRIQRYIIGEIGESIKIKFLENNRFIQTSLAVGLSFLLVLTDGSGKGGLKLWPLFGSTNQLLGSLTLLVLSLWLFKIKRNFWITLIPMILITIITFIATAYTFFNYIANSNYLLISISFIIAVCQIWIILEGIKAFSILIKQNQLKSN